MISGLLDRLVQAVSFRTVFQIVASVLAVARD